MGNRIPRTASKLKVTSLVDSSMAKAGTEVIANKTDHGWVCNYNGQSWFMFLDHLRNENYNKVEVLL